MQSGTRPPFLGPRRPCSMTRISMDGEFHQQVFEMSRKIGVAEACRAHSAGKQMSFEGTLAHVCELGPSTTPVPEDTQNTLTSHWYLAAGIKRRALNSQEVRVRTPMVDSMYKGQRRVGAYALAMSNRKLCVNWFYTARTPTRLSTVISSCIFLPSAEILLHRVPSGSRPSKI